MKFFRFLIIGLLLISTVSCVTTGEPEYDELTPEEYQRLVAKVRSYIKTLKIMPRSENQDYKFKDKSVLRNVVPLEEQAYINNNEPKFTAYYTGDKSGSFRMIWSRKMPQSGWSTIKNFTEFNITVRGKGTFLEDDCKLRLTISKFAR